MIIKITEPAISRPRIISIPNRIAMFLLFELAEIPFTALMMLEKKLYIKIDCIRLQFSIYQEKSSMINFPNYNGIYFQPLFSAHKTPAVGSNCRKFGINVGWGSNRIKIGSMQNKPLSPAMKRIVSIFLDALLNRISPG